MNTQMRLGPYELRGELGRGAMARVWRAWDPALAREVAIKEPLFDQRLPRETLDEMARRFVAEGKASARLKHPNIVDVYATDVWDGRPAIVMELVEGATLSNLLAKGPLPMGDALLLLDQLLDAVWYAHQHGVVHRDIKPDNIFVTATGRVKLADFGIAHIDDAGVTRLTVAGSVLGTPGYMSPEQALGNPIDARSDLFSIGVVAYEMLTGENPFTSGASSAATLLYRIVHEPAPNLKMRLPDVPDGVAHAIMASLEKNPDDRPVSADAFRRMLREAVASEAYANVDDHKAAIVSDRAAEHADVAREAAGRGATHKTAGWLPYALVAGACLIALAFAFVSATSGGGGGAARSAQGSAQAQNDRTQDEQAAEEESGDQPYDKSTTETNGTSLARSYDARDGESQGFSLTDSPYTLTVDERGLLCLYDASGRRMDDATNFTLDVSYLPEKAVARLEQGVTYNTFDEAWAEYCSTDIDCMAPVTYWAPVDPHPERAADEGPYWCIVIDVYPSKDEAERVAAATKEMYGVEVSVMRGLEWEGLFYWLLEDEAKGLGDGFCVVTGLSRTYQETLNAYLSISEIMGQPVDAQVSEAIAQSEDNWSLLDELSEIQYVGTRRYPAE